MVKSFLRVFDDNSRNVRRKVIGIYSLLVTVNILIWLLALSTFHDFPLLLGTSVIAYGFGLRHAVDADHIAAIDNVTRKLMQEGKRPAAVGFFFSLGHSTVVVLASVAIAITTTAIQKNFPQFREIGGLIGTSVSAGFLFLIAFVNIIVLWDVYKTFKSVKNGGAYNEQSLNELLNQRGLLGRFFRPFFRLIRQSWHMYPLGFLFGLGFDTATEIGLLGITAAEATKGLPIWSILLFPALFTAGMSLIDTTDGILMLGAYGWAYVKPLRKLYYNVTITFVSVLVALLVGGIEAFSIIVDKLNLRGGFWNYISELSGNFGTMGYFIVGIFIVSWLVSTIIYKAQKYDEIELTKVPTAGSGADRD
ncbi:MAG: HoxN/HupN/NixA family nickel/cobalt transporter [Bacteroidetes bacterium]|nr:HoxN/HupN/NixA family nickel/cobalt transporter [Bacteroidota bacterium]MCL5737669.1 HoxN/HupN/NixA family nickel/cobalt transporter [Bacteroidota bacterium]